MTNKLIIGILVLLLVLSSGLGVYAYRLNQQVNVLSEQLTVFQQEQVNRISAVGDKVTNLRGETLTKIGILEDDIGEVLTGIDTLEDETAEVLTGIGILEHEIKGITTEFSQSLINANKVYQTVSKATVRISDGETTVGSGFILDTKAHAVTAHHVVENLTEIYVVLPDGRISTATITGSCKYSDIAVLKLEDELSIEPLTLADFATVRVGEPIVTIGNPFNLPQTLTAGIVSQINRFAEIEYGSKARWVANLIQFDAAVNSGNSGSPLINSAGEVIGMVIARVNPNEGDGIYYAISSNKVKRITTSLIDRGSFDYPWLGIELADLTPQIVRARGLETANGVLVKKVLTGSPAAAAGIKVDDIIVAIDEMAIRDTADLTSYLGEHKNPGELVSLTLIRDTTKLELSFKIGKRSS